MTSMEAIMRVSSLCRLLPWVFAAAAAMPAGAEVSVSFSHPERYTDVGRLDWNADLALQTIEEHLKQLGERHLLPGRTLEVEVLDIDLAGRPEPRPGRAQDVRVVRGTTDWPSIKLRYTLKAGDRVLESNEESITDKNYFLRPRRYVGSEHLRYEKQMLDDWFKARFGGERQAPH